MVKQSMADDANINTIIGKWIAHGAIPFGMNGRAPRYGDFSSGLDFHTAMMQVREAERQFDMLPSRVRAKCDNDPQKFLEMVYDPARRDELVKLGLVEDAMPDAARVGTQPAPPAPNPEPLPTA